MAWGDHNAPTAHRPPPAARSVHSLRRKFLAVSLLTHVLVTVVMLAVLARLAGGALQAQLERQARHVGALLSPALAPMVVARDFAAAEELLQELTLGGTLVYARLLDQGERVLLTAGPAPADPLPSDPASRAPLLLREVYHAEQPLRLGDRPQGRVRFGIAVDKLGALHQRMFGWLLAIGTGGLLLAGTLQWLLSRQLTRRLERLAAAADGLATGAPGAPLDATGHDEAARLADSFNRMSDALQQRFEDLQRSRAQLEEAGAALESRVAERTLELQLARDEAERASKAKSEFLSRMSHELRTPLNAILGFAQLLRLQQGRPEPARDHSQEQLAHIERAGWHLLELIDEVLDLSRIESGMLAVSDESVALAPLIADCLNMVRPQAHSRGLDLRDESALPPGAQVRADATRLRQVLLNLLSNACKYNRPGGSISVETRALPAAGPDAGRLPADEDADWVEIAVADTGIGLAPDQLASLYEPFNRLGAETSATEGTGIGLVITRRLVELMQGRITVESTPGTGSRFRVFLRRACPIEPVAPLRPGGPVP